MNRTAECRSDEPLARFVRRQLRPAGRRWTPFNVISIAIMLTAAVLLVQRFAFGLGSITNLSQEFPWGLWVGLDVITGVAFAGGAYVIVTFMVHVLRHGPLPADRPRHGAQWVLGLHVFYAGRLGARSRVGRGTSSIRSSATPSDVSSVLFLVAWHFMLYIAGAAHRVLAGGRRVARAQAPYRPRSSRR